MSDSDLAAKVGMIPVVPSGELGKEVASRVRKIVAEKLRVAEEKVVDEANFVDDLGADSLDQAELVMLFEEEFGCEIPEDAAEKITTIKTAIDFLKKHATL